MRNSLLCLLALCGFVLSMSANTVSIDPNSALLLGPGYSFSKRDGYYDFGEVRKSQFRRRNNLNMFGAIAGKRFAINRFIRFQAGFAFEGGSTTDDTLFLSSPTSVKYSFYHASFEPELQFPLTITGRTRPYVLLGGGVNYLYVREHTYFLDNGQEVIWIDLPTYVRSGFFSVSGSAGFGFDYALARSATISLWYLFRYWRPVSYGVREDFPLQEQKYHETFFTSRFHLVLLFDLR
jgi:hypothetical protein